MATRGYLCFVVMDYFCATLQIMFQQLRPGNSYAKISWQDLFAAMRVYCERYSPGPEQQASLAYTCEHAL